MRLISVGLTTILASSRSLSVVRGRWSPAASAVVVCAVAIAVGSLLLATYTLSLGDPVPHRIDTAVVGNPRAHASVVEAVDHAAGGELDFHPYPSVGAALGAIDAQQVYAALDPRGRRPSLYVASAAGASVARVLEKVTAADPRVRVVDTHPLPSSDPQGLDVFYLMLVATVLGFSDRLPGPRERAIPAAGLDCVCGLVHPRDLAHAHACGRANPASPRLAHPRELGDSRAPNADGGDVCLHDARTDWTVGDHPNVPVLRRARQQLVGRSRGAAAPPTPAGDRLGMAPLGRHRDRDTRSCLLPRRPARAPLCRPGRVGRDVARPDARRLAPAWHESRQEFLNR